MEEEEELEESEEEKKDGRGDLLLSLGPRHSAGRQAGGPSTARHRIEQSRHAPSF